MFVEAVRRYLEPLPPAQTGWLAGLRGPALGTALAPPPRVGDHAVDAPRRLRRRQPGGGSEPPPREDVLHLQQVDPRVIGGIAPRRGRQRLVRTDFVAAAPQGRDDRLDPPSGRVLVDGRAETLEGAGVGSIESPADEEALRREGDVIPSHSGGDVGLVGRLVAGEADVAVDARDLGLAQPWFELRRQRLHRRAAGPLVDVLVGEEPVTLVVGGELAKELEALRRESLEWLVHHAPK